MLRLYLPACILSRGELSWPWALLTTHVVIVDPSFFAPMSTPSIAPSACDMTLPANAGPADVCAAVMYVAKTKASKAVAFFIGDSIFSEFQKRGAHPEFLYYRIRGEPPFNLQTFRKRT